MGGVRVRAWSSQVLQLLTRPPEAEPLCMRSTPTEPLWLTPRWSDKWTDQEPPEQGVLAAGQDGEGGVSLGTQQRLHLPHDPPNGAALVPRTNKARLGR